MISEQSVTKKLDQYNGVSNGINIKVIRDKNDNIEKLVETEAQELDQYVK